MNKKLFISRQEAAEMCGVNPQTITNWSKAGFFSMTGTSAISYVNRKSFEKWLKDTESASVIDKAKALLDCEREIEELMKEREQQRTQLKNEVDYLNKKTEMYKVKGDYMRMVTAGMFDGLLSHLIPLCEHDETPDKAHLFKREIQILRSMAGGELPINISKELGITTPRVRQVFYRAINKIVMAARHWNETVNEELPRLKQKVALQHEHVVALKKDLLAMRNERVLNIKAEEMATFNNSHNQNPQADIHGNDLQRLIWLMCTRADQYESSIYGGFSVRILNCLKAEGIRTMYELVTTSRRDFLRFRNFGKKSMSEMVEALEENGLCLEMNFDKDQIKMAEIIIKKKA